MAVINPGQLSIKDLRRFWSKPYEVSIAPSAYEAIHASRNMVVQFLKEDKVVYGVNTGFGALAYESIPKKDLKKLQKKLVLSHACGTGPLLNLKTVGLILFLKINSLAQGYSGVRVELIEALLYLLNEQIYPAVFEKGSVGASGDLAPLAHLSLPLIGYGEVFKDDGWYPSTNILPHPMFPLILQPKEGLALLNGLQVSLAILLDAFFLVESLFETALIIGALLVDAAKGSRAPFDEQIQQARGLKAQMDVAEIYRALLRDSHLHEAHQGTHKVQDPYSIRCQPQIFGAILQQISFVHSTIQSEINAVTDNPLFFSQTGKVLSGGNFHGEVLAFAADNLSLAIAEIGAIAERGIALLVDHHFSGLPAFLVKNSGINSGFMIAHVTAAACASDNKPLAHPHSIDSLPTSANQEDHVSMATNAARRLHAMIDNTATILAIELLAACEGLHLLEPLKTSPQLELIVRKVRSRVPLHQEDRIMSGDIHIVKEMIIKGQISLKKLGLESIGKYYT